MAWSRLLTDSVDRSTAHPIMPARAKGPPAASHRACPPRGLTGADERHAPTPEHPGDNHDLPRHPHRLPDDADLKALRP